MGESEVDTYEATVQANIRDSWVELRWSCEFFFSAKIGGTFPNIRQMG